MEYTKTRLERPVKIDGVYTVHYFEYTKDFTYSGELHNFWELVYADKKRLYITAGAQEIVLDVGQLYIHKPNEFHNIRCDGEHAANSVIVSFDCDCPEIFPISGMVITCGSDEKRLIGGIIKESLEAFDTPLGIPYTRIMEKSGGGSFGCEQMICLYIEQLLILLIRGNRNTAAVKKTENGCLLADICDYLEKNVQTRLRFEDVMHEFSLSASVIKKLFREQMDCGIMEYFARLKVDAAKQMIREGNYNFTEIADILSFNTSQYFTTVFRRISGMTPTEYSLSVRKNLNE